MRVGTAQESNARSVAVRVSSTGVSPADGRGRRPPDAGQSSDRRTKAAAAMKAVRAPNIESTARLPVRAPANASAAATEPQTTVITRRLRARLVRRSRRSSFVWVSPDSRTPRDSAWPSISSFRSCSISSRSPNTRRRSHGPFVGTVSTMNDRAVLTGLLEARRLRRSKEPCTKWRFTLLWQLDREPWRPHIRGGRLRGRCRDIRTRPMPLPPRRAMSSREVGHAERSGVERRAGTDDCRGQDGERIPGGISRCSARR